MTHPVDGQTQARAVRLAMERSALRVALETRDANHRRRQAAPLGGLQTRVQFLEAALERLAADVASLERASAHVVSGAARAVRWLGGVGDALVVGGCLVAWGAGAWLVAAVAGWPPAAAVACVGAPALALAPLAWRAAR